jgi:hypothetical protein
VVISINQKREETRMPANVRRYATPATLFLLAVLGRLRRWQFTPPQGLKPLLLEMAFTQEGATK